MDDNRERQSRYFEFFKHMTTLNTAAVAGTVAIAQGIDPRFGVVDLVPPAGVSFGLSLYLALLGMLDIMGVPRRRSTRVERWRARAFLLTLGRNEPAALNNRPMRTAYTCVIFFIIGLGLVAGTLLTTIFS